MENIQHTESDGIVTGKFAAGDPRKSEKNAIAILDYEKTGNTLRITEFRVGERHEGLRGEIVQELVNDMGLPVTYEGQTYTPAGEGRARHIGWSQRDSGGRGQVSGDSDPAEAVLQPSRHAGGYYGEADIYPCASVA